MSPSVKAHWYWGRENFGLAVGPVALLALLDWDTPGARHARDRALLAPYIHRFHAGSSPRLEVMGLELQPDELVHFEGTSSVTTVSMAAPAASSWGDYVRALDG